MKNINYAKNNGIGISIEWLHENEIGLVRGGRDFKWGDRFEFTATLLKTNNGYEIKGYLGYFDINVRKSLHTMLKSLGIDKVHFERKNMNKKRNIEIDL